MHDDLEPHSGVARRRRTRRNAPRSAPARRPGCAGRSRAPGSRRSFRRGAGIQKEWMTSRLVTTISTGVPAGRCSSTRGRLAAVVRIAEGPAPSLGLEPRSAAASPPAAAGGARRRPARRPPAAPGRRPASTSPPSTIQRCGGTDAPQPGRRNASAKRPMTSAKSTIAPASITHHSVAIDAAAGPEGSSVDSGPVQPARAATAPRLTAVRRTL